MIQVEQLSFRYEDETNPNKFALRDVSFEIREGEFVAIIGHNGSGKSTLSKLLNGIMIPTSGTIRIGGVETKDPESVWEVRKIAGMVFQNPDNQLVATVVEEDVAFGPENLGLPSEEIRRRVDRALETVGMDAYKRRSPHHLSGGQKQRVAIAGILAMEPRCIVFDESTAMLDPSGRREVMDTIRRLNDAGMTVLLVTHYMDEAVQADRVIVMDSGEIVMRGTPKEVFTQVDRLQQLGLDVPQVTRIAQILQTKGLPVEDCLTVEGLAAQFRRLGLGGAN